MDEEINLNQYNLEQKSGNSTAIFIQERLSYKTRPKNLFFAASVLCVLVLVLLVVGTKHAPLRTMRVRGDQSQWMTEEIRTAMKISNYLKNKLQRNKLLN